jgi:hypothetical protein
MVEKISPEKISKATARNILTLLMGKLSYIAIE